VVVGEVECVLGGYWLLVVGEVECVLGGYWLLVK